MMLTLTFYIKINNNEYLLLCSLFKKIYSDKKQHQKQTKINFKYKKIIICKFIC